MDFPIQVEDVSKVYKLYDDPSGRLKEALFRGRKTLHRKFNALKNVSFSVGRGETIGVIGRNGSGKSTLLQIIASTVTPTSGTVRIKGRISALLELGSGFDPEFTGRENVYMNGAILGLSQETIDQRFERIAQFANIGHFMDQPVKNYSSGMYVRLAFATAVNVDPDILLVDEALAVGDIYFQHRCMAKIREFQEQGKTIFFVTHDTGAVVKLCTKAILLDKGEMKAMGPADDVVQEYYKIIWNGRDHQTLEDSSMVTENNGDPGVSHSKPGLGVFDPITQFDNRFGNDKADLTGFLLTDNGGTRLETVKPGMELNLALKVKCHQAIEMPLAGFIIKDLLGNELIKTNSDVTGNVLKGYPAGREVGIRFSFTLPQLRSGSYSISAGFGEGTVENHIVYDWVDNFMVFTIDSPDLSYGLLDIPVKTHASAVHGNSV